MVIQPHLIRLHLELYVSLHRRPSRAVPEPIINIMTGSERDMIIIIFTIIIILHGLLKCFLILIQWFIILLTLLVKYFCAKHCSEKISFDKDALDALISFSWPGNVRELENSVERLLIMRSIDVISLSDLPDKFREHNILKNGVVRLPDEGYSLEQLEREIVIEALERNAWNQAAAARFLRLPRHTLIYRIEKYQIEVPEK